MTLNALAGDDGRKKSLQSLVDMMEKQVGSWRDKNDCIFISHGDCQEDVDYLIGLIKNRFGTRNFFVNMIGSVIGTHSGAGTVALFFKGRHR